MIYILFLVGLISMVGFGLRRRYLTNISDIPGPALASVSRAWHLWRIIRGDIDRQCIALHEKYGKLALSKASHISW